MKKGKFIVTWLLKDGSVKHSTVPNPSARNNFKKLEDALPIMERMIESNDECVHPVPPLDCLWLCCWSPPRAEGSWEETLWQVCLLHLQQESRHQMSSLPLCNIPTTTVTLKQSGSLSSAWPAVQVRHFQEELQGQGDAEEAQGESDKTFTSLFACSLHQLLQECQRKVYKWDGCSHVTSSASHFRMIRW